MDTPRFYNPQMKETARRLRHDATPAEQELWILLRARRCGSWRFVRQAPFGQYVLDFYCPTARLAIEVDGSIHEQEAIRQRDENREQALKEAHVTILRLTNSEVLSGDPAQLTARITAAAEEAAHRVSSDPHYNRRY